MTLWFRRGRTPQPPDETPQPPEAPPPLPRGERLRIGERYDGPVCFYQGSHYPVVTVGGREEGPDLSQRLLWVDPDPDAPEPGEGACFVRVADDAPTHLHLYHKREVEVTVK